MRKLKSKNIKILYESWSTIRDKDYAIENFAIISTTKSIICNPKTFTNDQNFVVSNNFLFVVEIF